MLIEEAALESVAGTLCESRRRPLDLYEYDEAGRVTTRTLYATGGEASHRFLHSYDEFSKLVSIDVLDIAEGKSERTLYEYDPTGRRCETTFVEGGTLVSTKVSESVGHGRTRVTTYGSHGSVVGVEETGPCGPEADELCWLEADGTVREAHVWTRDPFTHDLVEKRTYGRGRILVSRQVYQDAGAGMVSWVRYGRTGSELARGHTSREFDECGNWVREVEISSVRSVEVGEETYSAPQGPLDIGTVMYRRIEYY